MTPLYSDTEFNSAKSNDYLLCQCENCRLPFKQLKKHIKSTYTKASCCSQRCYNLKSGSIQEVKCSDCDKGFDKVASQIKVSKSGNHFCSKSCSASYNNRHKKHGTRRSKLEVWLEEQLTSVFPLLEFDFNKKNAINSELDIYIPSMKLAFELNGIFHYEAIFGEAKLSQIQNNDERKFQACLEKQIELCIIDASSLKYFKPANAQKYLDIIQKIIVSKSKN